MSVSDFFVPNRQIIQSISNSYPAIVTTTQDNGYQQGLIVRFVIPPTFGMQQLNNQTFLISLISNNSFSINVDTSDFDPFLGGISSITNITQAVQAVITVATNNFRVGQVVFVSEVQGMTGFNNTMVTILTITGSNLTVNFNTSTASPYTSGGMLTPIQDAEIIPVGEEALTLVNAVKNNYTIIPET